MEKYKDTYRIASARKTEWDYGQEAAYFVTICTRKRIHYFGEIVNDEMLFTAIGNIAIQKWMETPSIRPDMNITLDEFTLMPNHFHGIINIGENDFNCKRGGSVQGAYKNSFGPQTKNLASVIRGFKSSVTMYACDNNIRFSWQERFHDHIIRDDEDYSRIRDYIRNNPIQWHTDKFYSPGDCQPPTDFSPGC